MLKVNHGILLVNLGTPDNSSVGAVRRYLREFLSDPYVIDLPALPRWLLVNGIIAPFRAKSSAKLYQSIWTEEGSPLLVHALALEKKLQQQVKDKAHIALGMRYGKPNIAAAVDRLLSLHCDRITIVPLFPQYSYAASETAIVKAVDVLHSKAPKMPYQVIEDFYAAPGFIEPLAAKIKAQAQSFKPDRMLMSYHSIPVRQLDKTEKNVAQACKVGQPCPMINEKNARCYRAQCYATSRALAKAAGLDTQQFSVSFQSRLGRIPWVKPYTDEILPELYQQGVRRLMVVSPSFVADCLETLEELNVELQRQWLELGGEAFELVPCLNDDDAWVQGLADVIGC